ncbi:hypothetical protein UNDKW_2970 [Undibacterium sp. KW1]|uniref:hypothetical protein n=1 Tax=Undibacterium sp. KW1 TaxID=2058624 RepID=UPI001331E448|nr:hypothetical protein [Undibacterium sp. KW1]BBB61243.1 hypothetical protein UNDKW_2970 [Undibacterium sp. KW1]
MSVSFSELMWWILFPVITSLVLFIRMIVEGRGGKAFFSLLIISFIFYVVSASFQDGRGVFLCLLFGPWLVCITMFLAYLFKKKKKPDIVLEGESHPNHYYTRRVSDPCLFYGKDGRLLTYEDSLDHLSLFDINDCNEFLSSIGYPLAKKGESLDQSRQRCIDAYKKEYIKYS